VLTFVPLPQEMLDELKVDLSVPIPPSVPTIMRHLPYP
jgi:hypothetical protein